MFKYIEKRAEHNRQLPEYLRMLHNEVNAKYQRLVVEKKLTANQAFLVLYDSLQTALSEQKIVAKNCNS